MVKGVVLKPFGFSVDGINIRHYEPGDKVEIFDAIAKGLLAEGFMRLADEPAASVQTKVGEGELSVRHIGRGKYGVFRGEQRLTDNPLDKDEAEAALADFRPQVS